MIEGGTSDRLQISMVEKKKKSEKKKKEIKSATAKEAFLFNLFLTHTHLCFYA